MHRLAMLVTTWLAVSVVGAAADDSWNRQYASLRDEGIKDIGWIAGNAKGHPVWNVVRPYVDEGGQYYKFFMRLGVPGQSQDVEAEHNLQLYAASVSLGERAQHDEAEKTLRTRRVVDIVSEIGALAHSKP